MRIANIITPGMVDPLNPLDPVTCPEDVVVGLRACDIHGSNAVHISLGELPGLEGFTLRRHEPAGEAVPVVADVRGLVASFA